MESRGTSRGYLVAKKDSASSDTELVISCVRDEGRTIPYVVHRGTAGLFCYRARDRTVLLVRQFRAVCGVSLWEVPSGMVEAGEVPARTAARELAEETGVRAESVRPIGTFLSSVGLTNERLWLYWTDTFELPDASGEGAGEFECRWIAVDSAFDFLAEEGVSTPIDAKTALGVNWLARNVA
jgi:ADP-ribose pyrophosphatase